MTLTQSGSAFAGTMTSQMGTMEISGGEITGRTATWTAILQVGGQSDHAQLPGRSGRQPDDRLRRARQLWQRDIYRGEKAMKRLGYSLCRSSTGVLARADACSGTGGKGRARRQPVLGTAIPAAGTLVAVTNATIITATHGTIEKGTILIRNGKIAAVGKDIAVPAGAQVIDGTGKYVMPGIIDAHSHSPARPSTKAVAPSPPRCECEDVLREDAIGLYRELAGGVTTLNILHGSANTIGGQNAIVKIRWGLPVDSLLFAGAPPGIKFALGENVRQTNIGNIPGRTPRYPRTRMGVGGAVAGRVHACAGISGASGRRTKTLRRKTQRR